MSQRKAIRRANRMRRRGAMVVHSRWLRVEPSHIPTRWWNWRQRRPAA